MRYRRGLPLVLKSVNVEIKPGEKVGVCGRTGAGKSSLGRALLRLVDGDDEDNSCGSVEIDGVDIATVGRERLREAVTVIPQVCTQACQENDVTPHLFSLQHPTFFSGSLRFNLDPSGLKLDEELWTALEKTQMKSTLVKRSPLGLDQQVRSQIRLREN